jgi:arsenate reductase-like glutaredoxin family protein
MIILTVPACSRCKNVRSFLRARYDDLKTVNFYQLLLDEKKFKKLFQKVNFDPAVKKLVKDPSNWKEVHKFLCENPSAIPKPVVIVEKEDIKNPEFRNTLSYFSEAGCAKSCPQRILCLQTEKERQMPVLFEKPA